MTWSQTMTIYKDNKSTILLAENGKTSSSKRTQHLDIRYFFVTDRIKKGEVTIAYCPMQDMLGFFYETSAGSTVCMSVNQNPTSAQQFKHSCSQECVGAKDKNGWFKRKDAKF